MQDRQVRLWDLRTNICQGLLTVPGQQPCAAFDQQVLFLLYTVIRCEVLGPFTFHAAYPVVHCVVCLQVGVLRHWCHCPLRY